MGSAGRIGLTAIAVLAIAGVATWGWLVLRRPAEPQISSDPQALARFAASTEFAALEPAAQERYVDALVENRRQLMDAYFSGRISDDEALLAMRNTWQLVMERQLDRYFAMDPTQQRAFVDELIDDQEQHRGELGRAITLALHAMSGDPGAAGNQEHGLLADAMRLKRRLEQMPPLRRAQLARFMTDLQRRRIERSVGPLPGLGVE